MISRRADRELRSSNGRVQWKALDPQRPRRRRLPDWGSFVIWGGWLVAVACIAYIASSFLL